MGLISGIMTFLFGDGRNVVAETAEVFRENAENGAVRAASARSDSLAQFAAEFVHPRRGVFDRIVDGLNRLPRPALALGTIWLFIMGVIVSFYFGARHQVKAQELLRSVAMSLAAGQVPGPQVKPTSTNPALQDWQASHAD